MGMTAIMVRAAERSPTVKYIAPVVQRGSLPARLGPSVSTGGSDSQGLEHSGKRGHGMAQYDLVPPGPSPSRRPP